MGFLYELRKIHLFSLFFLLGFSMLPPRATRSRKKRWMVSEIIFSENPSLYQVSSFSDTGICHVLTFAVARVRVYAGDDSCIFRLRMHAFGSVYALDLYRLCRGETFLLPLSHTVRSRVFAVRYIKCGWEGKHIIIVLKSTSVTTLGQPNPRTRLFIG